MHILFTYIILAVAAFGSGIFLGMKDKRVHAPILGLILLPVIIRLVSTHTALGFPPFNWFIGGRISDIVVCFCALVIFGAGYGSIKRQRRRIIIAVFSALAVIFYVIYPKFFTLFLQSNLKKLQGSVYKEGICFQTSKYSCGPASGVMFLHALGVKTSEAEMAKLSETNNLTGTSIDMLSLAVNTKLKPVGLKAVYEKVNYETIKAFNKPFITTINLRFMVDHYIVVFDVKDDKVIIGDPLEGRKTYSKELFLKKWRRVIISAFKE